MAEELATDDDLSKRLGRDLTSAETDQVGILIELATELVLLEASVDELPADPPKALRVVCIEAVWRALRNPDGAISKQESLGKHSESTTFAGGSDLTGLYVTAAEGRLIRRALGIAPSASARTGSTLDDLISLQRCGHLSDEACGS